MFKGVFASNPNRFPFLLPYCVCARWLRVNGKCYQSQQLQVNSCRKIESCEYLSQSTLVFWGNGMDECDGFLFFNSSHIQFFFFLFFRHVWRIASLRFEHCQQCQIRFLASHFIQCRLNAVHAVQTHIAHIYMFVWEQQFTSFG